MEEKDKVEFISKEEIEKVINTINEVWQKSNVYEDNSIYINKVKEGISSLEGCTITTVVGILSTACLLLPAGAIMAVIDMAKKAFTVKAMIEMANMSDKECSDCNDAEDTKE